MKIFKLKSVIRITMMMGYRRRNEPKSLQRSARTLKFIALSLIVSLISIPTTAHGQQEEDKDENEIFTKMCRPFFPHVKALQVEEAEKLQLEKCFTLRAYPMGKSNHVHVSFRQWPFIGQHHCKDFIAKNISIGAYNKHMWPYGRWLDTSPIEHLDWCFNEDDHIADVHGFVQDCPSELTQLDIVRRDPVKTIAQSPSSNNPSINVFKFGLGGDNDENHGGICAVWTYKPDPNFSVRVASEMGGLKNAKDYFKRFSVTFLAELFIVPSEELKMEPFLYSVQTNTWNFDGANEKDHHKTRCHSPSLKHRNFHSQMFTQNIKLPGPLQQLISSLATNPPRSDREENDDDDGDRSNLIPQKNTGEAFSELDLSTSEPQKKATEEVSSSDAIESINPEANAADQIANNMSINVTVHEYTA